MRQLRLVGVADDGGSLLLETPTGEAFRLPLDERVRAACRGDLTRLGQIEIEMDNPLRPREIQARVRAGESAEEVAASSGMPLDRVLRFAYPVLQERDRVVAQARATQVRPKRPETLAELVEERLVGRGTDAATLRWDAWRREDGRWAVRLSWRHAAEHSALWVFQLATRSLQPDDPAAEQLSAEEFHARTITAVTPLAVAARVSGRPGGASAHPAGTGRPSPGDRPARGVEARAGRSPGAGAGHRVGRDPAGGPTPAETDRPTSDAGGSGGALPGPGEPSGRARVSGAERAGVAGTADTGAGAAKDDAATDGQPGRTAASGSAASGTAAGRTASGTAAGRTTASETAASGSAAGGDRAAARSATASDRRAAAGDRPAAERTVPPGGRRRAVPDADDGSAPAPPRRMAAGGESDLRAESDEERARRASVPSWDDILLGVRRRH